MQLSAQTCLRLLLKRALITKIIHLSVVSIFNLSVSLISALFKCDCFFRRVYSVLQLFYLNEGGFNCNQCKCICLSLMLRNLTVSASRRVIFVRCSSELFYACFSKCIFTVLYIQHFDHTRYSALHTVSFWSVGDGHTNQQVSCTVARLF